MPQFRAKARAIELLGKGQISDLPTAISELWKNGYDAYGDKLEGYLYLPEYEKLKKPFFVISDDGKGMTREDILDKWLILGTDAKTRNEADERGPETLGKDPRIKMGEKGIGRLSVAYLGSQMLMLTKKIGSPTQAVFFDWRILENYNLFIADINIPIKSIQSVNGFEKIFNSLKDEYLSNFELSNSKENYWDEQDKLKNTIIKECESLSLPDFFETEILSGLIGDSNDTHGTKFIIFNPDPQILLFNSTENTVAETSDDNTLYYLRTSLNGLFNVFKDESHLCETHIWIKSKEGDRDFISKGEFFSFLDFEKGDHLIEGRFNEYGEFNGKVRILEKNVRHKFFSHDKSKDKKTSYGPFNIRLGYVESRLETTRLSGEERVGFDKKCELYGGLYIYRDGFRVLPYGRRDHDFLEFEERRSRGAGFYFFSHRRMFGYIEMSREENEKLKDKASREGFINNIAYRDLTKDLRDFFIDLAKTYFRDAATTDIRAEQKEILESANVSEKYEKEKEKNEKKEFSDTLKRMPSKLQRMEEQLSDLSNELKKMISQPELSYFEIKEIMQKIEDFKIKSEELVVRPPSRFKLNDTQRKNFHDYNKNLNVFKQNTLSNCNTVLIQARDLLKEQELLDEYKNRYNQYSKAIEDMFQEYGDRLASINKKYNNGLFDEKREFLADFLTKYNDLTPKIISKSEIKHSLKLLEGLSSEVREKIGSRIEPFIIHLEKVNFDVNEDDLVRYFKVKYEEIEEEWNKTRELAQLGIAVEVIDHQFNVLYSQLSNTIESFSEYVKNNDNAKKHYNTMKNAFEHLENNYKLLQPLYRTTGRVRKEISGEELFDYVDLFFSNKLSEAGIKFSVSDAARKFKIFSYESILKPVFINIVNNAIYWLQTVNDRQIIIDSKGDDIIIMNSGEPIEDYQLEDIFKLFYSQRPKGRGIGLYLAKTSLNGIGYDIEATNDPKFNKLKGACFVIKPAKKR